MTPQTVSAGAYALGYAKLGWHVFPCWWVEDGRCACGDPGCRNAGKHPISQLVPRGHLDASIAPQRLASWWRSYPKAHIAVHMGASNLVAIDVDPRNGGDLTLEQVQQRFGPLDTEVEAATGGGGRHLVFSAPSDVGRLPGTLGPGVDVKLNGYIIVEPSGHISGGRYAWEASSDPLDGAVPSPLPDWLRSFTRPPEPAQATAEATVGRQTVIDLRSALASLRADDRDLWVAIGHALKPLGEVGRGLWIEWSQTSDKYDPRDSAQKWDSFVPTRTGYQSVFAKAQETGWINPASVHQPVLEMPPDWEEVPAPSEAAAVVRRNHLDWSVLAQTKAPAREWIWPHWLSWSPTLLAGRGGIGKSLFTQQLGTALATGGDDMVKPARPVRVLYWACEDDTEELWRRQERICAHLKVPMTALENLVIDARLGLDNTLFTTEFGRPMWTPLIGELTEQVNDLGIDVLFLDNIGQTFGANENDRHHVTSFANGIVGLVRGRKFCPVLVGHPAKSSNSEYSGSGAWENAVRMRWFLSDRLPDEQEPENDTPTNMRVLAKRKTNYSQNDILRMTVQDGVLVSMVDEHGASSIDHLWETRAENVVLAGLDAILRMGKTASETPGPAYLPKLLCEFGMVDGLGKAEVERAMRRLLRDGKLRRDEVGRYANRAPKYGLVRV